MVSDIVDIGHVSLRGHGKSLVSGGSVEIDGVVIENAAPRARLEEIFSENVSALRQGLESLRYSDPKFFVRCMLDIAKLVIPKESNVNINHGLDSDMRELIALGNSSGMKKMITSGVHPDLK